MCSLSSSSSSFARVTNVSVFVLLVLLMVSQCICGAQMTVNGGDINSVSTMINGTIIVSSHADAKSLVLAEATPKPLTFLQQAKHIKGGQSALQDGGDCPSECPSNSDYCDPNEYNYCIWCASTPDICYCTVNDMTCDNAATAFANAGHFTVFLLSISVIFIVSLLA